MITDLSHFSVIKVSGKDAQIFLQGQLTNDVRQVTEQHSQLTSWCTAKGRMLVNMHLCLRNDAYHLLLPQTSCTAILKRLQMYVLRSAVILEDVSAHLSRFGLIGNKQCIGDTDTILDMPGNPSRHIVLTEQAQNLWQCALKNTDAVGADTWELLNILSGLPQIIPITSEKFVPQMVNFQAIGGINFKKGCYTGQEVVARLRYLGALKRRMYLAKIECQNIPQAGDAINLKEECVGHIVNAQAHPDGGVVLLAVINIDSVTSEHVYWQQAEYTLQFMELPYALED